MYNLKIVTFLIFTIFSMLKNACSEYGECNKLTIEGGEKALKKIFQDFAELKETVSSLKSMYDLDQLNNQKTGNVKSVFDERVDKLPAKCDKKSIPRDCASATACTKRSGIYEIRVDKFSVDTFYVLCDEETEEGDWLVIQKRHDGSVDFYRNWEYYENGFGDIEGEFFIGLKKLHALTNYNGPQELLIVMEDVNATKAYAKYDAFAIGSSAELYNLKRLGKYSGTAGDSLKYQLGMKFTTKDKDNDRHPTNNCAIDYTGAWWYNYCHKTNLNGKYGDNSHAKGINWEGFRGLDVSLTYVKMMIRRTTIV